MELTGTGHDVAARERRHADEVSNVTRNAWILQRWRTAHVPEIALLVRAGAPKLVKAITFDPTCNPRFEYRS
jgi:hypothetical protein